jgi:hypothetical protein
MKKEILTALVCLIASGAWAQKDSTDFKCRIYNKEYDVYMNINFYDNNVKVPGQELFGEMPGYFGDNKDSRKWLITDAEIKGKTANLSIINDYGSEDLTAELTITSDGTYVLKQQKGSSMKIARNRKWTKIPKSLEFVRK